MADKLTIQFPTQGWKQFLTSRREMLDAFDRARAKSRAHEVETFHGNVAEAEFRKWLSGFLPKRYGVTPGYIVSAGLKSSQKTPHFDVIIYDQLEAPVLWIEDSPDVSPQGRSLAIPVEYVRCVLEVKSNLTSTTSSQGIEHLKDLLPLMGGSDDPGEKYKLHLPPTFCCGLVFFEIQEKNRFSEAALINLVEGIQLRGFFGGLVLRREGKSWDETGKISLTRSETHMESIIGEGKSSLLSAAITASVRVSEDFHLGAFLHWSETHFSQFGFDVLAMMQGTYDGRVSSFYGMGASGFEKD